MANVRSSGVRAATRDPVSAQSDYAIGDLGLTIRGECSLDLWEAIGLRLSRLRQSTSWAIGDWLIVGENIGKWGAKYVRAAEITGLSRGTLHRLYSVAKAFPTETRSLDLAWSFYWVAERLPKDRRLSELERCHKERTSHEGFLTRVQSINNAQQHRRYDPPKQQPRKVNSKEDKERYPQDYACCPHCSREFLIKGNRLADRKA